MKTPKNKDSGIKNLSVDKKGNPTYVAAMVSGRRIKVVVDRDNPDKIITAGD